MITQGSDCSEPLTRLSAYDYELPFELIAQHPLPNREHARMLVVDRASGTFIDSHVNALPDYIKSGDQFVFNDTKVIPARLRGNLPTGGEVEILLHKPAADGTWWSLSKPARKLTLGKTVHIAQDFSFEVMEIGDRGLRRIRFETDIPLDDQLEKHGEMPLPLYIRRDYQAEDKDKYQTVYAKNNGAVAAPTAGLHFTEPLLKQMDSLGVERIHVTLHVGLGTFIPITVDDIREYQIHSETCLINSEEACKLNALKKGSRRFCVGTTSVRTIESMTANDGTIMNGETNTQLYIYPGYTFKSVDALMTNFHVPKSSLLMLVSAFGGYELIREAYSYAVKQKYRFYSYGDSMLIL